MNAAQLLEKIGESLETTATVKSVFGEPIHGHGKTVVPVAKVAYGFGAGAGRGRHHPPKPEVESGEAQPDQVGEGGGGGGGVYAFPAGALEITSDSTKFVPFTDYRWLALGLGAGALLGLIAGLRRR
jgi:uncharacterized spore protein YtfJ